MRMFWLLILLVSLDASPAGQRAGWQLDTEASRLSFESRKNTTIRETHSFRQLNGRVDSDGAIVVEVDLMSVDTAIPIRDERMRNLLFKMSPSIEVHAVIDMAAGGVLNLSEGLTIALNARLLLNGKQTMLPMTLDLERVSESKIQVLGEGLIDVAAYGYRPGIEALREIAGLQHISTEVPYQLKLLFEKTGP